MSKGKRCTGAQALAFGIGLLLLVGQAWAQDETQARFDGILAAFSAQAQGWQGVLTASAEWLFFTLAIISFLWANMNLALRGGDGASFIQVNTQEVLRIGIMWVLLRNAYDWSTAMVMGFRQAGERAVIASGGAGAESTLDPAGVFQNGMIVAGSLFAQMTVWGGSFFPGPELLALLVCAFVVIFCFAFLAAFMAVVIVESYIVIGGAVLFLGFGGSPWTGEIAKRTLMYCVSVGAKLFALQLIVGVAMGSVIDWAQSHEADSSTSTISLIGLVLLITIMAKMIPELVQGMLNGASVGGAGTMLATGAAAVAAAVAGTAAVMSGGTTAAAQAGASATGATAAGATTGAAGAAAYGGAAGGFGGAGSAAAQAASGADAALGPMGNVARSAVPSSASPSGSSTLGGGSEGGGAGAAGGMPVSQGATAAGTSARGGGSASAPSGESASAVGSRTGAGAGGAAPGAPSSGAAGLGGTSGAGAPGGAPGPISDAPASDPGASLGAQTGSDGAGFAAAPSDASGAGEAGVAESSVGGSIDRAEAAPDSGKAAAFSDATSKGAQALGHIVDTATGYNPGGAIAPELAGLGQGGGGDPSDVADDSDGGTIRGDDGDARSRSENAKRGAAAGFMVAGPGGAAIGAAVGAAAGPKIDAAAARAREALAKAKNLTGDKPNNTPKE